MTWSDIVKNKLPKNTKKITTNKKKTFDSSNNEIKLNPMEPYHIEIHDLLYNMKIICQKYALHILDKTKKHDTYYNDFINLFKHNIIFHDITNNNDDDSNDSVYDMDDEY